LEFTSSNNKSLITDNYSISRASGMPIIYKIEDDINFGCAIMKDVRF
jgi:hypothetical protein